MGNNESKVSGSTPSSPAVAATKAANSNIPTRREPRRRDSIQALSTGKATAAPPSESLTSATAHSTSQTRSQKSHSRQRSRTVEAAAHKAQQAAPDKMGNEQSRTRPESHNDDLQQSSEPVNVPGPSESSMKYDRTLVDHTVVEPAVPLDDVHDAYYHPASNFSRPPRLPLPIDEESHTPGSPIISPADISSALDPDAIEGALPRRSSILSSTTVDDDEIGDELHAYTVDGGMRQTIPTVIEWKQGGERVYVTGTFAGWNRKFRLHKDSTRDGLSAVIQLPPGTHHLKFIVDGDMRTSDNLPTAVDYTNILVNYLEVSVDDIPTPRSDSGQQDSGSVPAEAPSPEALPPMPDASAVAASVSTLQPTEFEAKEALKKYTSEIPQYLLDLDQPEESRQYQRASAAITNLPPPPSLPMFLGKSILNGSTPMKDDSSVLNMPNHTVLNHLATSSIKNNILATSATTRYKRKYVTTIMYKPTNEEGE
ncbi:MAG: hypothetical protein M1827_000585 [Pycnora praestabilis]|nr:MAG: hypothetical protein M1827_000585 [Pycnora praestabilis]